MDVSNDKKREEQLCTEIKSLKQKMMLLAQEVEAIKGHSNVEYNIIVEHISIETLTLEQMDFSIEKIAVQELSGAMNIGNTFGQNTGQNKTPFVEKDINKEDIIKKLVERKENSTQQQHKPTEQGIKVVVNGKQVNHTVTN